MSLFAPGERSFERIEFRSCDGVLDEGETYETPCDFSGDVDVYYESRHDAGQWICQSCGWGNETPAP